MSNGWRCHASKAPGVRFDGVNVNGPKKWKTTCTIETADPGRELSWRVRAMGLPVAVWRYTFEPDGHGGTELVEHTEDKRPFFVKPLHPLTTGLRDRQSHNRRTMTETLQRIKAAAEGSG